MLSFNFCLKSLVLHMVSHMVVHHCRHCLQPCLLCTCLLFLSGPIQAVQHRENRRFRVRPGVNSIIPSRYLRAGCITVPGALSPEQPILRWFAQWELSRTASRASQDSAASARFGNITPFPFGFSAHSAPFTHDG